MAAEPEAPGPGDRRSEDDVQWLANGVQVQLIGLSAKPELNGKIGRIVGYHDEHCRYKVQLAVGDTVKLIARKNLLPLPPVLPETPCVSVLTPGMSSSSTAPPGGIGAGLLALQGTQPQQQPVATVGGISLGPRPAGPAPPTGAAIRAATEQILCDAAILHQMCTEREQGRELLGAVLSDAYLRLNISVDSYTELWERFCEAFGEDEDLRDEGGHAMEAFDQCSEEYLRVRTWAEYMQDEVKLTHYSIKRHGVLDTLRNQAMDLGYDVADKGRDVGVAVTTASAQMPDIVRQATTNLGSAVQQSSQVARAGGIVVRSRQQLSAAIIAPLKAMWFVLASGFLLCYLVPLFALRAFAPFNSVVANLGILYIGFCLLYPPSWAKRRSAKLILLLLWPLILAALPVLLHYWVMHPPAGSASHRQLSLPRELDPQHVQPVRVEDAAPDAQDRNLRHGSPEEERSDEALGAREQARGISARDGSRLSLPQGLHRMPIDRLVRELPHRASRALGRTVSRIGATLRLQRQRFVRRGVPRALRGNREEA